MPNFVKGLLQHVQKYSTCFKSWIGIKPAIKYLKIKQNVLELDFGLFNFVVNGSNYSCFHVLTISVTTSVAS